MGTTVHRQALEKAVDKWAEKDPARWARIAQYRRLLLENRECEPWLLQFIVQKGWGTIDLYDAFTCMMVRDAWLFGRIAITRIAVHATPMDDALVAENQAAIMSEMPDPFAAKVVCERGRGAESDGNLAWDKSIRANVIPSSSHSPTCPVACRPKVEDVLIAPGTAPLEIGSTEASRTLMHLAADRSLARWAYGSEEIVLAHTMPSWFGMDSWNDLMVRGHGH
jgi:hypothetical protein